MGQPVTISTSDVPESYCAASFREAWAYGVSLLSAQLAGSNYTFNFGATTPAPDDQDKPWLKTTDAGLPVRWYVYVGGSWVSPHPMPVGAVIMYEGAEASIETYDGGEAGSVTDTTGPMWEKVAELNGRFPLGPGTLASGTAVAVTNTGGEETHELTEEEIPEHTHPFNYNKNHDLQVSNDKDSIVFTDAGTLTVTPETYGGDVDGETTPHNNMPPYYAIFFIRRTARLHYRI